MGKTKKAKTADKDILKKVAVIKTIQDEEDHLNKNEEVFEKVFEEYKDEVNIKEDDVENDDESDKEKREPKDEGENKKKIPKKTVDSVKKTEAEPKETLQRTIFVGNLKAKTNKIDLTKLFKPKSKTSNIEEIRLRSESGAKFRRNDKDFDKKNSIIAFIRFSNKESAIKACQLNGIIYKNQHLRITMAEEKVKINDDVNPKTTVFVGNLKYSATDEKLYKIFEACGEIDYVRTIKNEHGCKGFAFVGFKRQDAVSIALQYNTYLLDDRPIRVTRCATKTQSKDGKKEKKENKKKNKPKIESEKSEETENTLKSSEFQGKKIERTKKKNKLGKGLKMKKILSKKLTSRKKLSAQK